MTVFAHELARRYGEQDIVSTSLTPGECSSQLLRYHEVIPIPGPSGVIKTDLQRHLRGIKAFIVVSSGCPFCNVALLIFMNFSSRALW